MRLEVTRRTDLATRALLTLAARGERMKAAELAEALQASPGFLSQAMTPLVGRGWVRSDPGPAGGYTTTADLAAISVLDVVEAVEGTTDEARCVLEDRACGRARSNRCAMHDAWVQARSHLLRELATTQLSTIPTPRP
jgi:Rrf2 family protein